MAQDRRLLADVLCAVLIVFVCFYVMCSTYCVCMFLCSLYAPTHKNNKFQVGVNQLGNKYYSDTDSDVRGELKVPQCIVGTTLKTKYGVVFSVWC